MQSITWTKDLTVDVEVLDDDQKKVFAMIDELQEAIMAGHDRGTLEAVLDRLMAYTRFHFAREEEFFAQTGYSAAAAHKRQHDAMVKWVRNVQARFKDGSVAMLSLELRSFLQSWWITHIQGSDKKYGPCLNAKGIH